MADAERDILECLEWAGIEFEKVNLVFASYGPGGVAVVVGLIMYVVRTVAGRWDGKVKR